MALTIEKISLPHAAVLAPMSGVTDMPFRRAVRRAGGGLVVTEMVPNSPAEAAGLRVGDRILNFAGHGIAHPYQLKALVPRVLPGTQASITVTRDHQRQTLTVRFPIVEPALDVERGEGTRQHQRPALQQEQQQEQEPQE